MGCARCIRASPMVMLQCSNKAVRQRFYPFKGALVGRRTTEKHMRLSKTIATLSRARAALQAPIVHGPADDRLTGLDGFGDNPGHLRARIYLPAKRKAAAPLVVVLPGCTQTAAGYDQGAGWSRLADRHGFLLLLPEQQRANNPNLCFNWFEPGDTARGRGEAASIAAMVEQMRARYGADPARTFVTGLSAGGAMASVMLAAYPELFAAGAIIAGLPYGCASNVAEAFGCMGGRDGVDPVRLGDRVRLASPHQGSWPRVSVWQGGADHTVAPVNADAIVAQWRNVHGLPAKPSRSDRVEAYPRKIWAAADGTPLIEQVTVTGMGHGTPLAPGLGDGRSGEAGAHMLDAAISSTDRIAAFFGIAPEAPSVGARARPRKAAPRRRVAKPAPVTGVQQVIEDALKAAGLMR